MLLYKWTWYARSNYKVSEYDQKMSQAHTDQTIMAWHREEQSTKNDNSDMTYKEPKR